MESAGGIETTFSYKGQSYRLLNRLGRGAGGEAYKVIDQVGHISALKLIPRDFFFKFENRVAEFYVQAQLNHPHIIKYFDMAQTDYYFMIRMEFFEGRTLLSETAVRRMPDGEKLSPLSPNDYRNLSFQIGQALAYMHERHCFHLDPSPENILISADGQCKLIDPEYAVNLNGRGAETNAYREYGKSDTRHVPYYKAPEGHAHVNEPEKSLLSDAAAFEARDSFSYGVALFLGKTGIRVDSCRDQLPEAKRRIPEQDAQAALIFSLLETNPRHRCTVRQALTLLGNVDVTVAPRDTVSEKDIDPQVQLHVDLARDRRGGLMRLQDMWGVSDADLARASARVREAVESALTQLAEARRTKQIEDLESEMRRFKMELVGA